MEITGVESLGSAPLLFNTPVTGNQDDPVPGHNSACSGENCFSCNGCVVSQE